MQLVLSIASDQSVVVVDRTHDECAEFGCDKCNDDVVLRAADIELDVADEAELKALYACRYLQSSEQIL